MDNRRKNELHIIMLLPFMAFLLLSSGCTTTKTKLMDKEATIRPVSSQESRVSLKLPGKRIKRAKDGSGKGAINVPGDYPTIQKAIEAASDGHLILVDDGLYQEQIDFLGKAITVRSVNGPWETTIEGLPAQRTVWFRSGEGALSEIDGFTITGGSPTSGSGGGIRCVASSPTIINCIVTNNTATEGGGIGCIKGSNPKIINCNISNNTSKYYGGGISCRFSSPEITNCVISNNYAPGVYYGGGIYCNSSAPIITNSVFTGNSAYFGGAVACYNNGNPVIINSTLAGNRARSIDSGNEINFYTHSYPVVINSIIWSDNPINRLHPDDPSKIIITYTDIKGGWDGEGNIDLDPLFAGNGDYHLTEDSPCTDIGTAEGAAKDDVDGQKRPMGDGIDMGFDEIR